MQSSAVGHHVVASEVTPTGAASRMLNQLKALLPGLGTIFLAIVSGAGGSALLELYYKPRRDRRKAAALLAAEISTNAELILLHSHFRKTNPRKIPRDFHFPKAAWEIASPFLGELPPHLLKKLLVLYARFDAANEAVLLYEDAVREIRELPKDSPNLPKAEQYANTIIDVFNTGLDNAFDSAKAVLPDLIKLAKIPKALSKEPQDDYEARVQAMMAERKQRLDALAAMDAKK